MTVVGGQPLYGTVRIPAAKNSVLPLLAASLLCEGTVRLCGVPRLSDVEASLALPPQERLIRVYMDMKGTQLYISFTNFTAGKTLEKVGGLFRTTKGEGHGFGLVRIDAIVERLEGYISRNSEDGAFTTEILLPQV